MLFRSCSEKYIPLTLTLILWILLILISNISIVNIFPIITADDFMTLSTVDRHTVIFIKLVLLLLMVLPVLIWSIGFSKQQVIVTGRSNQAAWSDGSCVCLKCLVFSFTLSAVPIITDYRRSKLFGSLQNGLLRSKFSHLTARQPRSRGAPLLPTRVRQINHLHRIPFTTHSTIYDIQPITHFTQAND